MKELKEEKIEEFLDNAYKLKEKDELAFMKLFYMLKGINMVQATTDKCQV